MLRHAVLAFPLVLLASSHPLAAQRARILGKVVDRAGKVVEGAEVRLRSHGWICRPELGQVHELAARTRKNGRFRAEARAGRRYSAWARLADGSCTDIVENVLPGRPVALRVARDQQPFPRVRIGGLDPWKHIGPFTFRCTSRMQNFMTTEITPDDDGVLTMPDWPGSRVSLEVLDAKGEVLKQRWISRVDPKRKKKPAKREDGVVDWKIEAPFAVQFEMCANEATETPIPGATIYLSIATTHTSHDFEVRGKRQLLRKLGTTDDSGVLRAELPVAKARLWQTLHVQAPGRMLTALGLKPRSKSFYTVKPAEDGSLVVRGRLIKGTVVVGRVVDAQGRGIEGLPLSYPQYAVFHYTERSSSWRTLAPRTVLTGKDGEFRFEPLMPNKNATVTALVSNEQLARLMPGAEKQGPPRAVVLGERSLRGAGDRIDFGNLGTNLTLLRVRVRDDDRPVSFAKILILRSSDYDGVIEAIDCNRLGAVNLLLANNATKLLAWDRESGYALETIDRRRAKKGEPSVLQLRPFRWVSGRVTDQNDKPIANARLENVGESSTGNPRYACVRLNNRLRDATRTDASGRFRYPFIPEPVWAVNLQANVRIGGKSYESANRDVATHDTDFDDVDFTIELPPQATKPSKK